MAHRCPRVLLADDHPVMLAGLRRLLEPELEVVGTVTDGCALLAAAECLRPGLVITDLGMPGLDGIEVTRRLQASLPEIKVLILSVHAEPSRVRAAFDAGAWGYLTKSAAPDEIESAVREVLADRFYISSRAAQAVIPRPVHDRASLPRAAGATPTARESQILGLLAEGLSNLQIARQLGVSVPTVRTHLNSLYEKLRLESRVALALYAARACVPAL